MATATQVVPVRRATRRLNVLVPAQIGQRIDAICFEMGISIREFSRYALTTALRDAEAGKEKFAGKVGRARMELRAEEHGFAKE